VRRATQIGGLDPHGLRQLEGNRVLLPGRAPEMRDCLEIDDAVLRAISEWLPDCIDTGSGTAAGAGIVIARAAYAATASRGLGNQCRL
jgi:hypothetical protein